MQKHHHKVPKEFFLPFAGLKLGKHAYNFKVGTTFFQAFENDAFDACAFDVTLILEKKETIIVLDIQVAGTADVACDRCNDPLTLRLEGTQQQIIKFGTGSYEETEEIDIIPENSWQIEAGHYIYELILLQLPAKRAHHESDCNATALQRINDMLPGDTTENEKEPDDLRWAALKGLKDQLD